MYNKKKLITIFIGFITGLINGLLGSGGGTILVPSMIFINGIEDHKAHATAISVILPITVISSLIYAKNNIIDIPLTIKITIGSTIGAIIGSSFLNKLKTESLRKLFGIIMISAAIRMVMK